MRKRRPSGRSHSARTPQCSKTKSAKGTPASTPSDFPSLSAAFRVLRSTHEGVGGSNLKLFSDKFRNFFTFTTGIPRDFDIYISKNKIVTF